MAPGCLCPSGFPVVLGGRRVGVLALSLLWCPSLGTLPTSLSVLEHMNVRERVVSLPQDSLILDRGLQCPRSASSTHQSSRPRAWPSLGLLGGTGRVQVSSSACCPGGWEEPHTPAWAFLGPGLRLRGTEGPEMPS